MPPRISAVCKANRFVLYMKGTPMFPMCPVSAYMAQALEMEGIAFLAVDVLKDLSVREDLKFFPGAVSPVLFVDQKLATDAASARADLPALLNSLRDLPSVV